MRYIAASQDLWLHIEGGRKINKCMEAWLNMHDEYLKNLMASGLQTEINFVQICVLNLESVGTLDLSLYRSMTQSICVIELEAINVLKSEENVYSLTLVITSHCRIL